MRSMQEMLATIQRSSIKVQATFNPEGAQMAELLNSAVAPATIQQLFPLDLNHMLHHLSAYSFSKEQLLHFHESMVLINSAVVETVNKMSNSDFFLLQAARLPMDTVRPQETAFAMKAQAKVPYRELKDSDLVTSLFTAGNVLCLSANWLRFADLHDFGSARLIFPLAMLENAIPQSMPEQA